MSYEKHTWETGETITAEKLNNLENGVENANILIVTDNSFILSHTWNEIYQAMSLGIPVYFKAGSNSVTLIDAIRYYLVNNASHHLEYGWYKVDIFIPDNLSYITYISNTPDGSLELVQDNES